MKRHYAALLALVPALAGCDIEFVGPESLRFTRAPAASLTLTVSDRVLCTVDGGGFLDPAEPRQATVCLQATFFPGVNVLGEQLEFLSDTLWIQGRPFVGTETTNGSLAYDAGVQVPLATLHETELEIRFPRFAADPDATGIRWHLVGRVQPDTLRRAPDEAVRLEVLPPTRASVPEATFRSWDVRVTGPNGTAALFGSGVPRASYDFAPTSLQQVGGDAVNASLTWTQQFFGSIGSVQTNIFASQFLSWHVRTVQPPSPPPAASGD